MKLYELKSPEELTTLEQYLDQLMRPVGLNVEFTRHFIERLLGRESGVTVPEIINAFAKLKNKYKKRLISAKKKPDYEAVLKDFDRELNIVFGIDGNELNNITIMRKPPREFKTNNFRSEVLKV